MKKHTNEGQAEQSSESQPRDSSDDGTQNLLSKPSETQVREIDVLNLPPRSEVHLHAKTGFHLKWNRPFIRFMIVILLLILLGVGGVYLQTSGIVDIVSIFKMK